VTSPFSLNFPTSFGDLLGLGQGGFVDEIKVRLPEFIEPIKFFAIGGAWVVGDLIGHQLLPATAGKNTPDNYYRNELIWAVPALAMGRLTSDWIGGPNVLRAIILGTVANGLMHVRHLFGQSYDFNVKTFMVHEAILVPLSLFIIGEPGKNITDK
jgi:hypothetical protein